MRYRVGGLKWSQRHRIKQSGMIAARPAFADDDIGDFFANETQSKVLTDDERGARIVEDVKGFKTPVYRLKKKLVEALYGIQIREV